MIFPIPLGIKLKFNNAHCKSHHEDYGKNSNNEYSFPVVHVIVVLQKLILQTPIDLPTI